MIPIWPGSEFGVTTIAADAHDAGLGFAVTTIAADAYDAGLIRGLAGDAHDFGRLPPFENPLNP